ncbi:MAG TPA: nucleoside transporter C-terminal domain-containing protein [Burkholderiales bacterium]|nr:nucleoside transporter C-terminal domain-containing protein [Burkholderiales bacterium]
MLALQSAFGFFALIGIAWLLSEDRRAFPRRIVVSGIVLQIVLAALLLKAPPVKSFFFVLNDGLLALERATQAGTRFVFGYLGGGAQPFEELPQTSSFILAFRALPLILVVSALSSLLFYWRVLPAIVRAISTVLEKAMGVGGAVGLSTAANIFVGMVEAPLFIRPYLRQMSRGELFIVMTCGMAGVAGTVMVLYASILGPVVPDAMGHILSASIISAPAAILVAAVMVPPRGAPTSGQLLPSQEAASSMDAVTRGTLEGLQLLLNIIALLIVLIALVTLVNFALGTLPDWGGAKVTLQRLLGYAMAPVVWLAGIPWSETPAAGALMGTKTVLNELIAYLDMARLPEDALSHRSRIIMTYCLCGFANFGSLGILIGGMATMVPERRDEIVALGLRSIVAGTLSTLMVGAAVGTLIDI